MRISKRWITLGLSLLGVAGVGVTSVVSIKCHDKVKDETDKRKKIIGYAPAIVSGVATGTCILASHYISAKEIAALGASCAYLAKNRDKIEAKIREKFGDEALNDIRKECVAESSEEDKKTDSKEIIPVSKYGGTQKFVDFYLGREFYSTLEQVEHAERELNWMFHNGMDVCMNDFYRLLGIKPMDAGEEFGWPANEDYYPYELEEPIAFEHVLVEEDGEPVYLIDIRTKPMNCWNIL